MNISKDYLITKEIAELLEVSEATVYKYIREGKIVPFNLKDWQIDKEYRFSYEEVEKVKQTMEVKPGFTSKEVAERVGCSTQTVLRYIKEGKLKSERLMYRGLERNFISEESLLAFEKEYKNTTKTHFVKDKCYLFQSFKLKEEGAASTLKEKWKARVMDLDEKGNGYAITVDEGIISLEELFQNYEPFYPVQQKKSILKKGTAIFTFAKPTHINSSIYQLIEVIQSHVGINNIRITNLDDSIILEMKPTFLPFGIMEEQDRIDLLKNHLKEGKLIQRENEIYIDSDIETVQTHISTKLKEVIQEEAKRRNMSLADLINEHLEKSFLYKN